MIFCAWNRLIQYSRRQKFSSSLVSTGIAMRARQAQMIHFFDRKNVCQFCHFFSFSHRFSFVTTSSVVCEREKKQKKNMWISQATRASSNAKMVLVEIEIKIMNHSLWTTFLFVFSFSPSRRSQSCRRRVSFCPFFDTKHSVLFGTKVSRITAYFLLLFRLAFYTNITRLPTQCDTSSIYMMIYECMTYFPTPTMKIVWPKQEKANEKNEINDSRKYFRRIYDL